MTMGCWYLKYNPSGILKSAIWDDNYPMPETPDAVDKITMTTWNQAINDLGSDDAVKVAIGATGQDRRQMDNNGLLPHQDGFNWEDVI